MHDIVMNGTFHNQNSEEVEFNIRWPPNTEFADKKTHFD